MCETTGFLNEKFNGNDKGYYKKAQEIKKTKADLILTACPSCTIGLRFGQLMSFNFKKTLELRDFINCELNAD